MSGFMGFSLVVAVAIVSSIIYKKIEPKTFKIYVGYVIGIIIVAALLLEPWRIFT